MDIKIMVTITCLDELAFCDEYEVAEDESLPLAMAGIIGDRMGDEFKRVCNLKTEVWL